MTAPSSASAKTASALWDGVNVAYIARQFGHAKATTTLNTYARWIEGADKGAKRAKLNEVMSTNCPRPIKAS